MPDRSILQEERFALAYNSGPIVYGGRAGPEGVPVVV